MPSTIHASVPTDVTHWNIRMQKPRPNQSPAHAPATAGRPNPRRARMLAAERADRVNPATQRGASHHQPIGAKAATSIRPNRAEARYGRQWTPGWGRRNLGRRNRGLRRRGWGRPKRRDLKLDSPKPDSLNLGDLNRRTRACG